MALLDTNTGNKLLNVACCTPLPSQVQQNMGISCEEEKQTAQLLTNVKQLLVCVS